MAGMTPAALSATPCADLNYRIQAHLDARQHLVDGSQIIDWRNTSQRPVDRLFFHLYLNAFANSNSIFMREGGGRLRGVAPDRPGSIQIISLFTRDGLDLMPFASVDFGTGDSTQFVVHLPRPVEPGSSLALTMQFRARLPGLVARSGYWGSFDMVAQWYPKLARLEPDGRWATFPYRGMGEFYADFACYELSVTVPENVRVGASGQLVSSKSNGLSRTEIFIASQIHDVVWSSYPHFRETSFRFDAIKVTILAPVGYGSSVFRHAELIRKGLKHFNTLFGRYPYSYLTIIIPPRGARAASAMEYPTLFVSGGPWWAWSNLLIPHPEIDEIVAHELAHQWFQGMIATNEVEQPMLDEGLAQWAAFDLLQQLYGPGIALGPFRYKLDYYRLASGRYPQPHRSTPSSLLPAYAYSPDQIMDAVYLRPALVLEKISRGWGRSKLLEALGQYARENRFAHPGLVALFSSFDRVYGNGFTETVLRPALEGKIGLSQIEPPVPTAVPVSPPVHRFFRSHSSPLLLYLVQAALGAIGT
jgi:hypothetical protein